MVKASTTIRLHPDLVQKLKDLNLGTMEQTIESLIRAIEMGDSLVNSIKQDNPHA